MYKSFGQERAQCFGKVKEGPMWLEAARTLKMVWILFSKGHPLLIKMITPWKNGNPRTGEGQV